MKREHSGTRIGGLYSSPGLQYEPDVDTAQEDEYEAEHNTG